MLLTELAKCNILNNVRLIVSAGVNGTWIKMDTRENKEEQKIRKDNMILTCLPSMPTIFSKCRIGSGCRL